jgi:membrane protease YdiL (CAAX protease family)
MVLALVLFAVLTLLFAVVYLGATGALDVAANAKVPPENAAAEFDRILGAPRVRAGYLAGQAAMTLLTVVVMTVGIDRRPLGSLGIGGRPGHRTGSVGWGLMLGVVLAAVTVLFISAVGQRHLRPELFGESGAVWAVVLAVVLVLVSFAEEWLFRGYLWVNLREELSVERTVLLTALVFAFFHSNNPGAGFLPWLNLVLVGTVIGQLREISGGLQVPFGLHAGWNLTVGMILGAQLSGFSLPSLLRVSFGDLSPVLAGGKFGPEASLVVTVLFGAMALYLGRRLRPKPAEPEWP